MSLITKLYVGYVASSTVICGLLAPVCRPRDSYGNPQMTAPGSIIQGSMFGFVTGLIPGFLPCFIFYDLNESRKFYRDDDLAFKKYIQAGMTPENWNKYKNGEFHK